MTTSDESIVETIRKLLRLADPTRGATQAEAELAMQKAQKLMTEHGIKNMTVDSANADEFKKMNPEIKEFRFFTKRQRYETDQYISRILRRCFSTRTLWSTKYEFIDSYEWTTRNPKTGLLEWDEEKGEYKKFKITEKYGRPIRVMKERLVYLLVGEQSDIDVSVMIIEELHPMMRSFLNGYLKENKIKWNAVVCHSFFEGITDGYIAANERGREEAMKEAGKKKADAYSIVLVDKDKAINLFVQKNIKTVPYRGISGSREGGHDPGAYDRGKKIGSKLTLGGKRLGAGGAKPKKLKG
jgi:hypothetical protein